MIDTDLTDLEVFCRRFDSGVRLTQFSQKCRTGKDISINDWDIIEEVHK